MVSRTNTLHQYPDSYFPETYLVIDVETTGFTSENNYITQFGAVIVVDHEVVERYGYLLNIPPGTMNPGAAEATGITEEDCNTKGVPREQGIKGIYDTMTGWKRSESSPAFVGHNVQKFDMSFIQTEFKRMSLPKFTFDGCSLIDTGAIVKAIQIGTFPVKEQGETMEQFNSRVIDLRMPGVYWNLDRYCMERFKLHEKMASDSTVRAHDASSDCVVTHWVLEALRAERQVQNA